MTIPIKYRKTPPVTINFDFADVLTNTGYATMYGFSDEADNKILIRQVLDSTDNKSTVTGTSGNVEANFDFTFEKAVRVKGEMFVSVTIFTDVSSTNTSTNDTTVEIFHFDDVTETTIGTQQAIAQLENPASTPEDEARTTLTFDIDRFFQKGEKLRIEVISTVASSNSGAIAGFYHDPTSRKTGLTDQNNNTIGSDLLVQVPFELNL